MIPGSGPGRGMPWWRPRPIQLFLWHYHGVHEVQGYAREGRTVAVIRRARQR